MAFLHDDEYILLLDRPLPNGKITPVDELKKLHDAGIQTAVWLNANWDSFCRDDMHTFNWGYFEDYLERMRRAGMKCIIPLWNIQSTIYPLHYYVMRARGPKIGAFSPWCAQAQSRVNHMLRVVRDELTSQTVQIVTCLVESGERILLNEPAYYDEHALADWQRYHSDKPDHRTPEGQQWLRESYRRLMMDQQRIVVGGHHREIWYMLSREKTLHSNLSCTGCEFIDDYLNDFQSLKPSSINHIAFCYFPFPDYAAMIRRDMDTWHTNEFVGAEYCEGLRDGNARMAVERGMRGLILDPYACPARQPHLKLEGWMVDEIRKANKLFAEKNYETV